MKITSEETIYTARYFKVFKRTIERNGRTYTKDFIERNNVVLILPYTANDEVYIESQYRDALERRSLEVVAGQIEEGDEPLETAKKELKEEAGLTARTWHKLGVWDLSVNMKGKIHVYAATDLEEGERALEEDEDIDMLKLSFTEVMKKVENGEMTAASHIAALLLFDRMRKEGKL